MDLNIESRGAVTVVAVSGSIDALTSPRLTEALEDQIRGGAVDLVADLGGVEYTSSAGLRSILSTLKESRRRGGDLRLAAIQPGVFRVLEMSGFTSILKHFGTVDDAVASFEHPQQ
jgi:anti-anti-sigma factor